VSVAERFDMVALFDERAVLVARVRVPVATGLPEVILWGNRHFVKSIPYGNYREGRVYLVPLQDMRATSAAPSAPPPGAAKK